VAATAAAAAAATATAGSGGTVEALCHGRGTDNMFASFLHRFCKMLVTYASSMQNNLHRVCTGNNMSQKRCKY
jgi:hypothetical protein